MIELKGLVPGLSAVVQKKIEEEDTAHQYDVGALHRLLAPPAYVDMLIRASRKAIHELLPEGFVTISRSMTFTNEAPTALGMTVTVKATLETVDGNRLVFKIDAWDEIGVIGHGSNERFVVNEVKLWDKTRERMGILASDDLN